jgi:hypothetical protein
MAPTTGPAPPVDDATELTVAAWRAFEVEMKALGTPLRGPVVPVLQFLKTANRNPTTREERLAIIDQADLLFDHLYPHLHFKRDFFGFVPPRDFLRPTRERVDVLSETEFHASMVAAFSIVRDAHTLYGLPSPYLGAVAFLPFQFVAIVDPTRKRRFLVSRVMNSSEKEEGFGHEFFGPGAEIVSWGEVPIELHVRRAAGRLPGGNQAAEFARAAKACTIRPLGFCHFPFNEEMPAAEIVYRRNIQDAKERAIRLPWGVARFRARPAISSKSFSVNVLDAEINRGVKRLQYPKDLWEEKRLAESTDFREVSHIPEVFEFQFTGGPRTETPVSLAFLTDPARPGARFGYLRIKRFDDGSGAPDMTTRLVAEARRILTLLDEEAPDGLVLDIRGNTGGDIEAAERMLQLLTPRRIEPENFHFANTAAILGVLRNVRSGRANPKRIRVADRSKFDEAELEFKDWLDDADRVPHPVSPERLTSGSPLTNPEAANDIGQVYLAPVVLLIDAFTYSAADIFAAGFQDHEIGFILGADPTTGGGGANVWNHSDLLAKLGPKPGIPVAQLPRETTMRLAIRRCSRVGANAGRHIEDFGVAADETYHPLHVDDVLAGMAEIVGHACKQLARMPRFRIDAPRAALRADGSVSVDVRTHNVASLRFFFDHDEEPSAQRTVRNGMARTFLVRPRDNGSPSRLRIEGFVFAPKGVDPRLVAVRTVPLGEAAEAEAEEQEKKQSNVFRRRRDDRRPRRR